MMRVLNLPFLPRLFTWRRKKFPQTHNLYDLVYRQTPGLCSHYCTDFRALKEASITCQPGCLITACFCFGNGLDVRRKSGSVKNCRSCRGNFLVCTSILADVSAHAMDAEEGNLFSGISGCWRCLNWRALFADDKSVVQVWNESLSGFGFLLREPFVSRIKSWDGNID